jgi:predicted DNA-binding protein
MRKNRNMSKIQVYLSERQNKYLLKESENLGITKSEYIRRIIDEKIEK